MQVLEDYDNGECRADVEVLSLCSRAVSGYVDVMPVPSGEWGVSSFPKKMLSCTVQCGGRVFFLLHVFYFSILNLILSVDFSKKWQQARAARRSLASFILNISTQVQSNRKQHHWVGEANNVRSRRHKVLYASAIRSQERHQLDAVFYLSHSQ